jgi:hypothetical protein
VAGGGLGGVQFNVEDGKGPWGLYGLFSLMIDYFYVLTIQIATTFHCGVHSPPVNRRRVLDQKQGRWVAQPMRKAAKSLATVAVHLLSNMGFSLQQKEMCYFSITTARCAREIRFNPYRGEG